MRSEDKELAERVVERVMILVAAAKGRLDPQSDDNATAIAELKGTLQLAETLKKLIQGSLETPSEAGGEDDTR